MKSLKLILSTFLVLTISTVLFGESLSSKFEKRIDKVLKKHFGNTDYHLQEILLSNAEQKDLNFEINPSQLFNLKSTTNADYYIFIDKAKGRHDYFTFIIMVNTKLEIEFISVIEYNEIYGYEISSKRWLAKFKGIDPSKLNKIKDIDAISGATISSKSIKAGIADVLKKIEELNNKGCLN